MQRKGRFELADRGTLFLDEIGDISLELQPKLLRAGQEQEFERLGSASTIKLNVRMIAATVSRQTMEVLAKHSWRRNVRELAHFIECAVIVTHGAQLEVPAAMLSTASETVVAVSSPSLSLGFASRSARSQMQKGLVRILVEQYGRLHGIK
jgi:transcriptional regulator with GAF, ATPase, and Fis domain